MTTVGDVIEDLNHLPTASYELEGSHQRVIIGPATLFVAPVLPPIFSGRCQAITRDWHQCWRRPTAGRFGDFCAQHAKQESRRAGAWPSGWVEIGYTSGGQVA